MECGKEFRSETAEHERAEYGDVRLITGGKLNSHRGVSVMERSAAMYKGGFITY